MPTRPSMLAKATLYTSNANGLAASSTWFALLTDDTRSRPAILRVCSTGPWTVHRTRPFTSYRAGKRRLIFWFFFRILTFGSRFQWNCFIPRKFSHFTKLKSSLKLSLFTKKFTPAVFSESLVPKLSLEGPLGDRSTVINQSCHLNFYRDVRPVLFIYKPYKL